MARRLVGVPQERAVLALAERVGTSERRILGWEPKVYSYDAEGNMLGWTQAEPEWDDQTRMRHLALAEYNAGVHDGCGLHDSIAREDPHFTLQDDYCPVEAAIDLELRERADREHEAEKDLKPSAKRAADGRTTRIRLLSPAEIAKLPKG